MRSVSCVSSANIKARLPRTGQTNQKLHQVGFIQQAEDLFASICTCNNMFYLASNTERFFILLGKWYLVFSVLSSGYILKFLLERFSSSIQTILYINNNLFNSLKIQNTHKWPSNLI